MAWCNVAPQRLGVNMNASKHENDAREVIAVLDKLIASDKNIIGVVDKCRAMAAQCASEAKLEKRTAQLIIMHYSNLCAAGGGASALPGMIPFVGTIFSIFGAGALDAILALKFELEMTLALSHLGGFDISNPRERKIAFLLASASLEEAYDVEREPSLLSMVDLAMGEYSTRELSKSLIKTLARVIMMVTAKRYTKFFPVVGIAIGASVNKVLSTHMGHECWRAIRHRRDLKNEPSA